MSMSKVLFRAYIWRAFSIFHLLYRQYYSETCTLSPNDSFFSPSLLSWTFCHFALTITATVIATLLLLLQLPSLERFIVYYTFSIYPFYRRVPHKRQNNHLYPYVYTLSTNHLHHPLPHPVLPLLPRNTQQRTIPPHILRITPRRQRPPIPNLPLQPPLHKPHMPRNHPIHPKPHPLRKTHASTVTRASPPIHPPQTESALLDGLERVPARQPDGVLGYVCVLVRWEDDDEADFCAQMHR